MWPIKFRLMRRHASRTSKKLARGQKQIHNHHNSKRLFRLSFHSPSRRTLSPPQSPLRRSRSRSPPRRNLSPAPRPQSLPLSRPSRASLSPLFPRTHYRSRSRNSHASSPSSTPNIGNYNVNREIFSLAQRIVRQRQQLPNIQIPQFVKTQDSTVWPINLPIYFISIKSNRERDFVRRCKAPNVQLFAGTNGKTMNVSSLKQNRTLINSQLKIGEIGCYDSHLRLLQKIAQDKTHPLVMVCEDDVNLTADSKQTAYLKHLLDELKQTKTVFDILYLSWFRPVGGVQITTHTRSQSSFCQLWCFLITPSGAQKLLNDPFTKRMHYPVDVAYFNAATRNVIRPLLAYPPLCLTVGQHSDTARLS